MRALHLAPIIALAGCYHPAPQAGAPCNERGECPSGLRCIADLCQPPDTVLEDAAIDVAIDVCPELSCVGNDLAGCSSRMTCSLGCADAVGTTLAHCMQMVPSNGITPALLAGATADVSPFDYDFDTETGEITVNTTTVIRPAGTGVLAGINFTIIGTMAVFSANSWSFPPNPDSGDDTNANGSNTIALYAATTITVAGIIDAGGSGSGAGPGGGSGGTSGSSGPTCRGKAGLWQSVGRGEGGGGGGGRTAGGNGAVSNLTTFGAGGPQCSTSPTTIPLVGGNGGGAGGAETAPSPDIIHGGDGGGGGGGLALVAMESITIMSTGVVGAPGDGGESLTTGDGGGGGGGGGAILIEAPVVSIMGKVTANGGGGAAPSGGDSGSRGHMNDASSAGGGVFMTGAGGRGGTGTLSPNPGTNFTDATTSRGGGGGGAAGRMEIKSRMRNTTGSVMSPGPALNDISTQ